jgi:protein KRI1
MINGEGGFDGDGYEGESEPPNSTELKMLKAAKEAAGAFNAQDIQEELYKLDYEDIVAGIPCRFKYRQVDPESYGLTAEDILLADDKELNDYVSLRKFATYRDRKDKPLGKLDKKRKRLRFALRERLESLEAEKTATKKHKVEKDRDATGEKSGTSASVDKNSSTRKRQRKKKSKGKDDSTKEMNSSTRRKSLYD